MSVSAADQDRSAGVNALAALKGTTGPLIGLILLCLFLSFATDTFMSARNLLNILDQITVLGIGGIDLAVGSVMALTMMVMGYLANQVGLALPVGIILALAAAAVTGAISGILITALGVPAFIATLAMMSVARGLANMITDGQQIVGFPSWFSLLAYTRFGGFLTLTVAVMLVVFVLGWIYLRYTTGGRSLYAIGGNQEVARLAGINVNLYTIGVYVVSGLLAGLAGVVLAMRLDSVQPTAGVSYELDTIAAVVIGGTSLSGGKGGILGTIIGVLIIGVLRNGLNLLGVSPFTQAVVIGVVIALAVAAEAIKRR
jgi:ribose transport system permease protein